MRRSVVVDTHALVWYLSGSPRLSIRAQEAMDGAVSSGGKLLLSSISIVEIVYLVEKGKIPRQAWMKLLAVLEKPASSIAVAPLDQTTAVGIERVSRADVPDMPDRIIAATALGLGIPLVTRDRKISSSGIDVIW